MNIQKLAAKAIERINSMTTEELEQKFIEHGYLDIPSKGDLPIKARTILSKFRKKSECENMKSNKPKR
jgi:hypothetical protein